MPQQTKIESKAASILEQAQKAGAQADVIINQQKSLSLKAQQGELEEHKVSSTQIFGLRVIKDGQVGIAYSESEDDEALSSMVTQALTNAQFAAREEHETLLDNTDKLRTDDDLLCREDDSTIDQKIDMLLKMEQDLRSKDKIAGVPYNGLSESVSSQHIASTSGLSAFEKQRSITAYAYALAQDGDKSAMEGAGQVRRIIGELDLDKVVAKTTTMAISMLDGAPVPSQRYDIIFDTDTQNSLFGVFQNVFSGKWAKDGINPWRDKVGKTIADKRLELFDNPLLTEGFHYCLFDSEGVATAKTPLIIDGTLQTLLHNSVTASHFDIKTTGHASRGAKSPLSVGMHQLEIAEGTTNKNELESGEYLYITDLTGLHSGANPVSGDFSFGASGYLKRDGEEQQVVRGITVAGNFYEMLHKISAIGDTASWDTWQGALMPAIRFADMVVSGE